MFGFVATAGGYTSRIDDVEREILGRLVADVVALIDEHHEEGRNLPGGEGDDPIAELAQGWRCVGAPPEVAVGVVVQPIQKVLVAAWAACIIGRACTLANLDPGKAAIARRRLKT